MRYYTFFALLVLLSLFGAGCSLPMLTTVPVPAQAASAAAKESPIATPKRTPTPAATESARQGAAPPVAPAPSPTTPANPLPFATKSLPPLRLTIPSIGLDSRVVRIGTKIDNRGLLAWETAAFAVGHHAGTANPGERGNVVLSGHISSPAEGDIFRHLPRLKVGDGVIVATADQQFIYRVVETQTVVPQAVEVLDATDAYSLTLITCVPDGVYSHRLVVRAERL